MKNKKSVIFILLLLIQLAFPAYIILKSEYLLKKGVVVKIKVMPIDPYDIFRGRYVRLRLDGLSKRNISESQRYLLTPDKKFFAILNEDDSGFMIIESISDTRPKEGIFLEMKCDSTGDIINQFDKFFLNQEIAPEAEDLYRESLRNPDSPTYITVKIKNGSGVLQDLYVNGKEINSYFE